MKRVIPALFMAGATLLLIGAASYITGWTLSPYL